MDKVINARHLLAGSLEEKILTLKTMNNLAVTDKGWDFLQNTSFDKPFKMESTREKDTGKLLETQLMMDGDTTKVVVDDTVAVEEKRKNNNIESKEEASSSLKFQLSQFAYLDASEEERHLLLVTSYANEALRKEISFDDYKILLDKWKDLGSCVSGTDEQKEQTLNLLYALASTKDGFDFIKNFDSKVPFRLEPNESIKELDFHNFRDNKGNLKPDTIRLK
jgi:hypothetical protein